ncbi:hypothetical protein GGG16DRAFT_119178 [Schizophyllum commune]
MSTKPLATRRSQRLIQDSDAKAPETSQPPPPSAPVKRKPSTTQMPGGKKPKTGAGNPAKPPATVKPLPTSSQLVQRLKAIQDPPQPADRLAPGTGSRYTPLSNHSPEVSSEEKVMSAPDRSDDNIIPDLQAEGVSTPASVPPAKSDKGTEIVRFSPSQATLDEIDIFFQNMSNANLSVEVEGKDKEDGGNGLQPPTLGSEDDDIQPRLDEPDYDAVAPDGASVQQGHADPILIALPASVDKHTVLDDFDRVVRAAHPTEGAACDRFRTIYLPSIVKHLDGDLEHAAPASAHPTPPDSPPTATLTEIDGNAASQSAGVRAASRPAPARDGPAAPVATTRPTLFNRNGETPGPFPPAYGLNEVTIAPDLPQEARAAWADSPGVLLRAAKKRLTSNASADIAAIGRALKQHLGDVRCEPLIPQVQQSRNRYYMWLYIEVADAAARAHLLDIKYIIRPHITLRFLPLYPGLNEQLEFVATLDGLTPFVDDSTTKQSVLNSFCTTLRADKEFGDLVTHSRDNVPEEYTGPDLIKYVLGTTRIRVNKMKISGGTGAVKYYFVLLMQPPSFDPAKWEAILRRVREMSFATKYGTGKPIAYDPCCVCGGTDHDKAICPLPQVQGYVGPLPGKELNPAAIRIEQTVPPDQRIGTAHLVEGRQSQKNSNTTTPSNVPRPIPGPSAYPGYQGYLPEGASSSSYMAWGQAGPPQQPHLQAESRGRGQPRRGRRGGFQGAPHAQFAPGHPQAYRGGFHRGGFGAGPSFGGGPGYGGDPTYGNASFGGDPSFGGGYDQGGNFGFPGPRF